MSFKGSRLLSVVMVFMADWKILVTVISYSSNWICCFPWKLVQQKNFILSLDFCYFPGHYVFIEASAPRNTGDIARLWTPPLAPSNGQCISFWYNMHGTTMGTINVYAVKNTANPTLGSPLWSRTGNAGKAWIQQYIQLPSATNYSVCN